MTTEPAAPSTERSRSMMIAAVYGDGTPPTWFIQRLDDVIAAARAEAAREPTDQQVVNAWRHAETADDYTDSWTADLARGRRFLDVLALPAQEERPELLTATDPRQVSSSAQEERLDFVATAQRIRSEHEATHGEAEMCGAECIVMGLADFDDEPPA